MVSKTGQGLCCGPSNCVFITWNGDHMLKVLEGESWVVYELFFRVQNLRILKDRNKVWFNAVHIAFWRDPWHEAAPASYSDFAWEQANWSAPSQPQSKLKIQQSRQPVSNGWAGSPATSHLAVQLSHGLLLPSPPEHPSNSHWWYVGKSQQRQGGHWDLQ